MTIPNKTNCSNRLLAKVLGVSIDVIDWETALNRIYIWASNHESRWVCICNVHSVVSAKSNHIFSEALVNADMVTPDGAPLAWMLNRLGFKGQQRINGPDLMWKYCELAATRDESIYLYGGSVSTLSSLQLRLTQAFPRLKIAGAYSPPFRELTAEECRDVVLKINTSGAGSVWVSLGCPKQELWMANHRGIINAVMIGVGAAFDYHAGPIMRAPKWMQNAGFEWLYRLASEPRRLWKRYFFTNTIFIIYAARQLIFKPEK
jgi:N-acetylglucosaminyldiphosphoundecaprenol N-acetyl-beta-D-mannosaminyltransferase